jgi:hypothetical protein
MRANAKISRCRTTPSSSGGKVNPEPVAREVIALGNFVALLRSLCFDALVALQLAPVPTV